MMELIEVRVRARALCAVNDARRGLVLHFAQEVRRLLADRDQSALAQARELLAEAEVRVMSMHKTFLRRCTGRRNVSASWSRATDSWSARRQRCSRGKFSANDGR